MRLHAELPACGCDGRNDAVGRWSAPEHAAVSLAASGQGPSAFDARATDAA